MYIVVGANGFLGSYVRKNIIEKTEEDILALVHQNVLPANEGRVTWRKCDISKCEEINALAAYMKGKERIKIVYLAAYHLPDQVQKNPRYAWNINITSLSYFLNAMENVECMFYISTEMVYGEGAKGHLFREKDALHPVNIYGKQKMVAESLVLGYGFNVLRLPFMIGSGAISHKKHFYDVIVETLESGNSIEMFEDAFKSALDFDTAASVIVDLAEVYKWDMPKILNIAGDEILSKYEIGLRIARKHGFDESLVKPIRMDADNQIFKEKRAGCTLMDNNRVKEFLGLSKLKIKM